MSAIIERYKGGVHVIFNELYGTNGINAKKEAFDNQTYKIYLTDAPMGLLSLALAGNELTPIECIAVRNKNLTGEAALVHYIHPLLFGNTQAMTVDEMYEWLLQCFNLGQKINEQ